MTLALLGMAAVAALSWLVARGQWQVHGRDYAGSCTPTQDGSLRVLTTRTAGGRPVPARAVITTERVGAAEKMFLEGLSKDFGTVARGTHLLHRFPITNIHQVPVTIAYLQPSCGCVSAVSGKSVLKPSESTTIDVGIDTGRFIGPAWLNVRAKVTAKDWESTCRLQLSTLSHAEIVVEPSRLTFGSVPHGQAVTRTVHVHHFGAADWQVNEAVTAKEAPFTAELRQLYRRNGQIGYRLRVTLKADAPIGPVQSYLSLRTNDPQAPVIVVPVEGMVRPKVTVVPDRLDLGTVTAGEVITRRVLIRAEKPFRVTGVDSKGDGVSIHVDQPSVPAAVQPVTLHCTFAGSGPFEKQLSIHTDLPDPPPTITVKSSVTAQP